jgi:glucose/arabinose dehydrogenase
MIRNPTRGVLLTLIVGTVLCHAVFLQTVLVQTGRAQELILTTRLASGLARPVFVTSPPGDDDHLYIVEQHTGQIRIMNLDDNTIEATPFLDLASLATGNEQGLLGLAFHPDYENNGQFYVSLTPSGSGQVHVRRYTRSVGNPLVADPGTLQNVLIKTQPAGNHNGGWLGFNPQVTAGQPQYLHISSGDGGGANDQGGGHIEPGGNAQNLTTNLGKILRIDVDADDFPADANRNYSIPPTNPFAGATMGNDEIWHYGLRNPWRASFDRQTGDMYIGDVGQGAREEIDYQPANSPGGINYGWRLREGLIQTPSGNPPVGGMAPAGAVDPIHEYPRSDGFSVSGGYVYRGPISSLQGDYFFADYGSARVWSFRYDGANKTEFLNRTPQLLPSAGTINEISSFGEDNAGNLYILDLGSNDGVNGGEIYRIESVVQAEPLVPAGASWQYLDNGTNQGTAWRGRLFDDTTWKTGPAQLGYGESDQATVVDCGPAEGNECVPGNNPANKYITTYFRHHFDVENPADWDTLILGLLRDDGAAVYLNGQEVVRTANLAPNANSDALANFGGAGAVDGANESTFFTFQVDPGLLESGENVLAVEIHQHSQGSSDISFDLRLSGVRSSSTTPGDLNGDGVVDRTDVAILAANYGLEMDATREQGDLSDDDKVGLADLAMLQASLTVGPGGSVPVPEPATWLVTGVVCALLLCRSRKARGAANGTR